MTSQFSSLLQLLATVQLSLQLSLLSHLSWPSPTLIHYPSYHFQEDLDDMALDLGAGVPFAFPDDPAIRQEILHTLRVSRDANIARRDYYLKATNTLATQQTGVWASILIGLLTLALGL